MNAVNNEQHPSAHKLTSSSIKLIHTHWQRLKQWQKTFVQSSTKSGQRHCRPCAHFRAHPQVSFTLIVEHMSEKFIASNQLSITQHIQHKQSVERCRPMLGVCVCVLLSKNHCEGMVMMSKLELYMIPTSPIVCFLLFGD